MIGKVVLMSGCYECLLRASYTLCYPCRPVDSNLLAIGSLVARGFGGGYVRELETRSEGPGNRYRTCWAILGAFSRGVMLGETHQHAVPRGDDERLDRPELGIGH
jgi:hypothetical protein